MTPARRCLPTLDVAAISLLRCAATGQPAAARADGWTVPRTASGHPDLQGVIPLERSGDAIFETACHGDEDALPGLLGGARSAEQAGSYGD